jgi:hypothetical protein
VAPHVATCAACQERVAELQQTALVAGDALRSVRPVRLPSATETAMARQQLASRQREPIAPAPQPIPIRETTPMFLSRISTPWRLTASGLAAAILVSLIVAFTPEGRTAAAGFLATFRSQQVAPIEISPQSQADITRTMNALGSLGTLKSPNGVTSARNGAPRLEDGKQVTMAEATLQVGFAPRTPDATTLKGLDPTPRIQVMPANEIRFVFDKARAAEYFRASGHPDVSLPDKFDGATLIVSIPSAVLLQYGSTNTRDALIIGQSGELVVDVQGKVTLDELRDFLLGLPGLPKETTDQLRLIGNWRETLPVPIPTDKVNWKSVWFNGSKGLLLNDNSGVGSAAIWQSDGRLYGLAGSLKADDLKRVADSLK